MTDWSKLRHAYGRATDVPALLADLSPDPDAEVWVELWSRICHQGSVYSASFAALPPLLDASAGWSPVERLPALFLAAAILASDDVRARRARRDLLRPHKWVIPHFQQLCRESLTQRGIAQRDFIYLLQAGRTFDGDRFWGLALDELVRGEFAGTCPLCGADLHLVVGEYGFFVTAEEWVNHPDVRRVAVMPNPGDLPAAGQWMYDQAQLAGQSEVAIWIRYLFGTSECPSCGREFALPDAIEAT